MTLDDRYRVWAPRPRQVVLRVNGEDIPMREDGGGWWYADRPARHGDTYGFVLDGDGPFPDPRSRYQASGVHGLSTWIDHATFPWTDARWQPPPFRSATVYELHVGTFTPAGTFDAIIDRLRHLVDLGITHVELMPVCEFPGPRGWGYDGVDLFAPHSAYGGPDGLKRLVDACHGCGLAVILDVVYNHLGPAGNYLGRYGPYFTDRYKTPWGEAINFDGAGSDEVRRFVCDNARMWLRDYHVDGLRLDAVHAIVDTSARHILEQLADEVDALEAAAGRHLVLIAESDLNDPRVVQSRERGGYGIDAQWSDDFHHALHAVLTGERSGYYEDFGTMAHLASAIRKGFVYAGAYSTHRQRVHGRAPLGIPGWRFVVAAQNHDQVGNRARGERLSQLVSRGRLKIAAALLLTAPFVPMLFQGEEWGASTPFLYFTGHEDEELGRLVAEGRRGEFAAFGWDPLQVPDPQAASTFEASRLDWDEVAEDAHADLLAWHRALIAVRRTTPSLREADHRTARVAFDEQARWIVVRRGDMVTACNLSSETTGWIGLDRVGSGWIGLEQVGPGSIGLKTVLASDPRIEVEGASIRLAPESAAVVRIREGARS